VLDELLETVNLKRDDVYVTNVVKDRPPNNRDPHRAEIDLYAPFLDRQIAVVQPSVIATLGRFAMEFVIDRYSERSDKPKISQVHGQVIDLTMDYGTAHLVPLYHPAVALYNASQKDTLIEDFKTLVRFTED
jgi:DNA polymerase